MTEIITNSDFITRTVDAKHIPEVEKDMERSNELIGYVQNDKEDEIQVILDMSDFGVNLRYIQ